MQTLGVTYKPKPKQAKAAPATQCIAQAQESEPFCDAPPDISSASSTGDGGGAGVPGPTQQKCGRYDAHGPETSPAESLSAPAMKTTRKKPRHSLTLTTPRSPTASTSTATAVAGPPLVSEASGSNAAVHTGLTMLAPTAGLPSHLGYPNVKPQDTDTHLQLPPQPRTVPAQLRAVTGTARPAAADTSVVAPQSTSQDVRIAAGNTSSGHSSGTRGAYRFESTATYESFWTSFYSSNSPRGRP